MLFFLDIPGVPARFKEYERMLGKLSCPPQIQWLNAAELNQASSKVYLSIHLGGLYNVKNKPDYFRLVLEKLDLDILSHIRRGKVVLVLDCSGEGVPPHEDSGFNEILTTFADFDIAKPQIFLTASVDGDELHKSATRNLKYNSILQIIHFPSQLIEVLSNYVETTQGRDLEVILAKKLSNISSIKRYLTLNYMPRPVRYILMLHLLKRSAMEIGYQSFFGEHVSSEYSNEKIDRANLVSTLRSAGMTDDMEKQLQKLEELSPMTLDFGVTNQNRAVFAYGQSPTILYDNSICSIVSESDFEGVAGTRMTEKSLKPLILGHPILILGSTGVAKLLRNYGFKPGCSIFSDNYDKISDPKERLLACFEELDNSLLNIPVEALRRNLGNSVPDILSNNAMVSDFSTKILPKTKFYQELRELATRFDLEVNSRASQQLGAKPEYKENGKNASNSMVVREENDMIVAALESRISELEKLLLDVTVQGSGLLSANIVPAGPLTAALLPVASQAETACDEHTSGRDFRS